MSDYDNDFAANLLKMLRVRDEIIKSYPGCKELFKEYEFLWNAVHETACCYEYANGYKAGKEFIIDSLKADKEEYTYA